MVRYRTWLIVAVLLFAGGTVFGMVAPTSALGFMSQDIAALQELSRTIASLPPIASAILIFAKNAVALILSFALSPMLCLMPILTLTVNGWLLGWVSAAAVSKASLGLLLAGILPHGIIEIPAFIIGEAAALSLGSLLIVSVFRQEARKQILPGIKKNLRYLMLALALLLPAAFIEAFVTPLFLR